MSLDLDELRNASCARQAEWDPGTQTTLLYRAVELGGEAGEALNIIKKLERELLGIRGARSSLEALFEELADIVICADLVAQRADPTRSLADAIRRKFNKTSEANSLETRL
jgi:hypothetical protein